MRNWDEYRANGSEKILRQRSDGVRKRTPYWGPTLDGVRKRTPYGGPTLDGVRERTPYRGATLDGVRERTPYRGLTLDGVRERTPYRGCTIRRRASARGRRLILLHPSGERPPVRGMR